jgi:arylsulfatase
MKAFIAVLLALLVSACGADSPSQPEKPEPDIRPNILLIVADDLGYADLGVYGSEISTPNIDSLADEGMIFTQFHAGPSCGPTRAMLLSGNNNHVAGMARQNVTGIAGDPYPGYENHLSDRIIPFPELLQASGYHTYMAGKWHLGKALEHSPVSKGFERSFALLAGAGSHYSGVGFGQGASVYREDKGLVDWPEGAYSTEFYTDKLLEYMESNRGDGKPFFVFAAYTSPHWPLQVPDEYLDLYVGQYDQGYDLLREERMGSLKAAGIIPADSRLPLRNDLIEHWDSLTTEEQRRESRKMELYAAMVDNLDDHVGRLITYLKENALYDNTLIVFIGDNGAAGEDFYHSRTLGEFLQGNYDNSYPNMGKSSSFVSYGRPWAEAGSAPFHRYKTYSTEGGLLAPMLIAGPGVQASGAKSNEYLSVMDVAPTFLEITGVNYPAGGTVQPMRGESFLGYLAGSEQQVHDEDYVTAFYHDGRAFLRKGKWKLSTLTQPFSESKFRLFDFIADPGEMMDLAKAEPEVYRELIELWRTERKALGIVLPQEL